MEEKEQEKNQTIGELVKERDEMKDKIEWVPVLEAEKDALTTKVNEMTQQAQNDKQALSGKATELDKSIKEVEELSSKVRNLEEEKDTTQQEYEFKISELESNIKSMQTNIEELTTEK